MEKQRNPRMIVFAGNNGSGKSTLRHTLFEELYTAVNIDPDLLAKKYAQGSNNATLLGGKEAIRMVNDCIQRKVDFSLETTLSGKLIKRQIESAKRNGFDVYMYFVGTNSVEINIERIKQRVLNGGHDIPEETVRKRGERIVSNVVGCLGKIDYLRVVDSTYKTMNTIFISTRKELIKKTEYTPEWVTPIVKRIKDDKK
ncbi:zeta toxin family protein (plasmid) [Pontibacillus sp. ALD_SL1]|uniref:zeta toxin family protein n=1 Tax=Pontibacillus sp. ALD_SL1 TaxID=2777185 RepID=UPI001A9735FA|nr:zeta toxin family protein [Pontibacillus sp. ALD_SL1]QST02568.1 zeta toxin family protein [Pontibacillus sp. ALD_SL1]